MPTYEYRCPKGHEFEVVQKMSDEPGAECPRCGKAAERLISGGGGLLFKGDGFYITDYRSEDYRKKAEKDGKAAKDGKPEKAAASDSSEAKPTAKTTSSEASPSSPSTTESSSAKKDTD